MRAIISVIKKLDPVLFGASFFLSCVSILTIFGSVDNFGRSKLIMQVAMTVLGILFTVLLANIDYRFLVDRYALWFFIGSAALLGITLIFGISGINMQTANKSWITIPFINISIQPSEFVKIAFICTFAKHINMVKGKLNSPRTLLGLMIHAGVIVGLIMLSGDLGVALVYMGIIVLMLFCGGLCSWYFLAGIGALVLAAPLLWIFLEPYQKNRIIYGFRPDLDPTGLVARQPLMSREAIAGGGLFGRGLFEGGRYEDLTASHTDFIFATVCEKFGYVGGALVVIALVVLVLRLFYLSFNCRDNMGRLICCGCAAVIVLQTVENLWMCLALVPVVGITLPFVSCGGSSVLATYILVGLAHSAYARENRFYFGERRNYIA